MKKQNLVIAKF